MPPKEDEVIVQNATTRMQTLRDLWKTREDTSLSQRVMQAMLVFVGCAPKKGFDGNAKIDIRYSVEGNGFEYGAGKRYTKVSIEDFMTSLVIDGDNSSSSLFGMDVVTLATPAEREDKVVEKVYVIINKCPHFTAIAAAAARICGGDWQDPFQKWVGDSVPKPATSTSTARAACTGAASGANHQQPRTRNRRAKPAPGSEDSDGPEWEATETSSSDSESSAMSDGEPEAGARSVPKASKVAVAVEPMESGDWLDNLRKLSSEHSNLGEQLERFQSEFLPRKQEGLGGATRIVKKTPLVPAQAGTCQYARKILEARAVELPSVQLYLADSKNHSRTPTLAQRQMVSQAASLLSEKSLSCCRAGIGSSVGGGKTGAAAMLVDVLCKGLVQDVNVSSGVVFAPVGLHDQWKQEIESTLPHTQIWSCEETSEINKTYMEMYGALDRFKWSVKDAPTHFLILPSHVFNKAEWVEMVHCWQQVVQSAMVFDEVHLNCKRVDGEAGGNMAGLCQHTPMDDLLGRSPNPMIFVTATPLNKKKEALSVLLGMGLVSKLPSEVLEEDKDSVAQAIVDAVFVKPSALPVQEVPPYPIYYIETPPPSVDATLTQSAVARQYVAGNGLDEARNPVVHAAMAAVFHLLNMGKSTLFYYDNKKGIKSLRESIRAKDWGDCFFFFEGDMSPQERRDQMRAMMEMHGPVVCFSTIALMGTGTNLGGRIDSVIFCAPSFTQQDLMQCIGRAARPPNFWQTVVAYMFLSQDWYSRHMEALREKKTKEISVATGATIAKGPEDKEEAAARPALRIDQIFPIVTGLDTLAQSGLALNLEGRACFALSPDSPLQPPATKKDARGQHKAMVDCVKKAKEDAADPTAAEDRKKVERDARREEVMRATAARDAELAEKDRCVLEGMRRLATPPTPMVTTTETPGGDANDEELQKLKNKLMEQEAEIEKFKMERERKRLRKEQMTELERKNRRDTWGTSSASSLAPSEMSEGERLAVMSVMGDEHNPTVLAKCKNWVESNPVQGIPCPGNKLASGDHLMSDEERLFINVCSVDDLFKQAENWVEAQDLAGSAMELAAQLQQNAAGPESALPDAAKAAEAPPDAAEAVEALPDAAEAVEAPPDAAEAVEAPPDAAEAVEAPPDSAELGAAAPDPADPPASSAGLPEEGGPAAGDAVA